MPNDSDTQPPAPSPRPAVKPSFDEPAPGPAALQAPWRLEYLERVEGADQATPTTGSFLRDDWLDPAEDHSNHVIVRTGSGQDDPQGGMILLNAYPYANGHLLVALGDPRPTLLDYDADQRAALWRLVDTAAALMRETLRPQGVNIGINQSRAAGAGVPQHLHVHLVPRWSGDTNFISVVGQIRVIPCSLEAMAERYRNAWERIRGEWKA